MKLDSEKTEFELEWQQNLINGLWIEHFSYVAMAYT